MLVKKAYKYRIYPEIDQTHFINQTCGACRKVYNVLLDQSIKQYELYKTDNTNPKPNVSSFGLANQLTALKTREDLSWLKDYSYNALQQKLLDLGKSYSSFLSSKGKIGYPKFRNRFRHNTFRLMSGNFSISNNTLYIAKLKTPIQLSLSRPLPSEPSQLTISKTPAGEYYVSFLCEYDQAPITTGSKTLGIDLGITNLAVTSDGQTLPNPKNYLRLQSRLAICQRRHAKKHKDSKNREKSRLKVASVHARIANSRLDYMHKLTTRLVKQYKTIVIEDLAVANMARNHHLSKHVLDSGFRQFRTLLQYKVIHSQHVNLVIADRWEPSTQRCSVCQSIPKEKIKLGVKSWTCQSCQTKHDRDFNASKNLEAIAYRSDIVDTLAQVAGHVILAERIRL